MRCVASQPQGKSPTDGFRARLSGASLWDLVQMECLARARRVVRVSSGDEVGYLYFADGQIAHAQTRRAAGEAAALEILQWQNGSFEPCQRIWPPVATIQTSHEALLLQVAKVRDEARAEDNLVTFPGRLPAAAPDDTEEIQILEIEQEGEQMAMATTIEEPAGVDFPVALRLGPNGTVIRNKGASEDLAAAVAYATRLTELMSELLGAGRFVAMECAFKEGRCLMFAESNGDTVALRPRPDANLTPLRDRLGL
jgi:hypothetical protein